MNSLLAGLMEKKIPKFNDDIVESLAIKWIPFAGEFLDEVIRSNMKSAPDNLEYLGWRVLTPKEEIKSLFNSTNDTYDISRNDIYKIELMFRYNGEEIPNRYVYLPFVERAGIMTISDTHYHFVPVLTDTVISPNYKEVFVKLLRDKLIFKKVVRAIIVDGKKTTGQIIYSDIYRIKNRNIRDNLGISYVPTALYHLAELGLETSLQKYLSLQKDIIRIVPETTEVDPTKWRSYESTKIKPRGLKVDNYIPHNYKILVKSDIQSDYIENLVNSILFTMDVFPNKVEEMVAILESGNKIEELMFWKLILGRMIFKDNYSVDRIYADINDHFNSLRSYIDDIIKAKLAGNNIFIEDFFDLLKVIIENYNHWLLHSKEYNNNVYNKYLEILYYAMFETVLALNKTIFEIVRKSAKKDLTMKDIIKIFNNHKSTKKIFTLVKSTAQNISLMLADYVGDNLYSKLTAAMELQERGDGVKRGTRNQFPESVRSISGTDLYVGTIMYLNKKAPTGRLKANPFMNVDLVTGKIKPDDAMKMKLDKLDRLLQGKAAENTIIKDSELTVEEDITREVD